jgi:hypothetical protein
MNTSGCSNPLLAKHQREPRKPPNSTDHTRNLRISPKAATMNPFGVLSNMGVGQTPEYNAVSMPNGFTPQDVYEMQRQLDALGMQRLQPDRPLDYQNEYQNNGFRSPSYGSPSYGSPSYGYSSHPDEVFNQAGSQFEGFGRIDGYWDEFDMRKSREERLQHRNHRLAIRANLRMQGVL